MDDCREKNGKCSHCASCCGNILPLSQSEIDEIHRYIKKNHIKECKKLAVLAEDDLSCPFLDQTKATERCTIYPERPGICVFWTCNAEKRQIAEYQGKADFLTAEKHFPVDMREEFFGGGNG